MTGVNTNESTHELPYVTAQGYMEQLACRDVVNLGGGVVSISVEELAASLSNLESGSRLILGAHNLGKGASTANEAQTETTKISYFDGRLAVDLEGRSVEVDGDQVAFTAQQFRFISYLMTKPEKYHAKEQLYTVISNGESDQWRRGTAQGFKHVDVIVSYVRKKLATLDGGKPSETSIVRTSRGFGYGFFTKGATLIPRE